MQKGSPSEAREYCKTRWGDSLISFAPNNPTLGECDRCASGSAGAPARLFRRHAGNIPDGRRSRTTLGEWRYAHGQDVFGEGAEDGGRGARATQDTPSCSQSAYLCEMV